MLGERLSFTHCYQEKNQTLQILKTEPTNLRSLRPGQPICVKTAYVQTNLEIITKILETNESLILVGPQGSGKNLMIQSAIQAFTQSSKTKVRIAEIFCNS